MANEKKDRCKVSGIWDRERGPSSGRLRAEDVERIIAYLTSMQKTGKEVEVAVWYSSSPDTAGRGGKMPDADVVFQEAWKPSGGTGATNDPKGRPGYGQPSSASQNRSQAAGYEDEDIPF